MSKIYVWVTYFKVDATPPLLIRSGCSTKGTSCDNGYSISPFSGLVVRGSIGRGERKKIRPADDFLHR